MPLLLAWATREFSVRTSMTVTGLRVRMEESGWELTEMAGGPWIIYGYNGEASLCVMGKTRLEVWQMACHEAEARGLLPAPASGKG